MTMMTKEEADPAVASGEVRAGIERAFDEVVSSRTGAKGAAHPDTVRLMGEAFDRTEATLGSNVLPFRRPGGRA
ncbi:hypothetical protein ACYQR9_02465 [Methylobacterium sp. CM6241]